MTNVAYWTKEKNEYEDMPTDVY